MLPAARLSRLWFNLTAIDAHPAYGYRRMHVVSGRARYEYLPLASTLNSQSCTYTRQKRFYRVNCLSGVASQALKKTELNRRLDPIVTTTTTFVCCPNTTVNLPVLRWTIKPLSRPRSAPSTLPRPWMLPRSSPDLVQLSGALKTRLGAPRTVKRG